MQQKEPDNIHGRKGHSLVWDFCCMTVIHIHCVWESQSQIILCCQQQVLFHQHSFINILSSAFIVIQNPTKVTFSLAFFHWHSNANECQRQVSVMRSSGGRLWYECSGGGWLWERHSGGRQRSPWSVERSTNDNIAMLLNNNIATKAPCSLCCVLLLMATMRYNKKSPEWLYQKFVWMATTREGLLYMCADMHSKPLCQHRDFNQLH